MNAISGSKDGAACGFAMQRYSGSIPHFHCQPKSQCKTNKVSEGQIERKLLSGIRKEKKRPTHIKPKSHNVTKSDKIKLVAPLKSFFNAVIYEDDNQGMKLSWQGKSILKTKWINREPVLMWFSGMDV